MTEFEKWFEETYPLPRTMERGPIGRDMKNACKAAWRTALKWAKAMHDVSSEPKFNVNIIEELKNDRQTPIN